MSVVKNDLPLCELIDLRHEPSIKSMAEHVPNRDGLKNKQQDAVDAFRL